MTYFRKATASLPLDTLDGGGVASVTLQDERPEEKQRVSGKFNDTGVNYPSGKCVHELFSEQAVLHSGKVAVVCGEEQLTYQQLYEKSQDLALYLQSLGVKPDSLVGLCMERSLDMVAGLLGILQAGGACVPLDPNYPDERLAYMLQDSQAAMVLTQEKLKQKVGALVKKDIALVMLDRQWPEIEEHVTGLKAKKVQLQQQVQPYHLAYMIYTSGSTGQPKGVMIEHGSLVNHNRYAGRQYQITAEDIQIQISNISFDLFFEEVFVALNNGAQLIIEQRDKVLDFKYLEKLIKDHNVTTLNIPTALFHELVISNSDLNGIKTVIVGGEALAYSRTEAFVNNYPDIALHNTYGPTETTIISTAACVTKDLLSQHHCVPIGLQI